MRGALRFAIAGLAAGLWLAPAAAPAQEAASPANNQTVGPRELQNFSLSGNVTRSADAPAPVSTPATPARTASMRAERATAQRAVPRPEASRSETANARVTPERPVPSPSRAAPARAQQLQQATSLPPSVAATPASTPLFPTDAVDTTGTLAPEKTFSFLPWLLAAIALTVGGGFLFWRNRMRPAYAGGAELDLFAAPEPESVRSPSPPPKAAPTPPRATEPPVAAPVGIVSTGLRPWLDVGMQPLRCIVTDDRVTFEFELDLFNSGSAPARATHIAAVIVNAGPTQDQQLKDFFGQPAGPGDRIDVIQPLKRATFTTQIAISRDQVQILEMGERAVFVPLIAFNVTYGWGVRQGQTSVSYLLGRDGKGEKLAPFRLDLGPRVFRGLGARLLPTGVRK